MHVAAVGPAQLPQPVNERCDAGLFFRIVRCERREHADAPHPLRLLRTCRERPCDRRTAEKRNELTPPHVGHGASSPPATRGPVGARHERPRGRGAADERDELAAQFSVAEKQHLLKFAN
jgi:hypothetical protein